MVTELPVLAAKRHEILGAPAAISSLIYFYSSWRHDGFGSHTFHAGFREYYLKNWVSSH